MCLPHSSSPFPPCLPSPEGHQPPSPPLRRVIPTPRSVCMLTPLVSFRVLSILSQTVIGVVSTWLHFLQCGPSGSSGKQDGVGDRGVPSWLGLGVPHSGRRERGAGLPEVEKTSLHLSAGRKSSSSVSGQVSLQPHPPHPHPCPS